MNLNSRLQIDARAVTRVNALSTSVGRQLLDAMPLVTTLCPRGWRAEEENIDKASREFLTLGDCDQQPVD